ncbi:MAG: hypothetical protein JWN03_5694 [Nocardia sp.]|uniref:hypothetical protein n=1 Tax=Nocardia sp. TaxID=1821 RepID=UPI00260901C4|nr:hypothetical protein [Nocardia sp.]MCU1645419.1 hypothetical protein [Nocardia sp.]
MIKIEYRCAAGKAIPSLWESGSWLARGVAIPEDLLPLVDRVERAITGVAGAVQDARFDRRSDEPGSGLRVDQAVAGVEAASREWFAVSGELQASLELKRRWQPRLGSECQAAESALTMLHLAVTCELALAQPLDWIEGNPRLQDIPGWPGGEDAVLTEAASGAGRLLALLRGGTDDDSKQESFSVYSDNEIAFTIRAILSQSSDAIGRVFAGLSAVPLVGVVAPDATDKVREMLERLGDWAIERAIDVLPQRVTALVRIALGRARGLLLKVLGAFRDRVVADVDVLVGDGAAASEFTIGTLLGGIYAVSDVNDRACEAFNAPNITNRDRQQRGGRLVKLKKSNNRWVVGPVEVLALGLPTLWTVTIPLGGVGVAAAVPAAAILLAWVVLMSGDQLDASHYPNFWKGVVRRSAGE